MIKLTRPLISVDIESTGVDAAEDRIVELALITLQPDGTRESKCRRINPGVPIPPIATEVHGITDAGVKDSPSFAQIARSLAKMFEGCDITGYNIEGFDLPMLAAEFGRAGVTSWPQEGTLIVDAYRIFKAQEPHTLKQAFATYCEKDLGDDAHSAEADAGAALSVLLAQSLYYIGDERATLASLVPLQRHEDWIDTTGKAKWVGKIPVVNFGKWSGTPLEQVDAGYFDWVEKKDFPEDFKAICRAAAKGVYPEVAS